ncbi:hypothetical protein BC940DRAFT_333809 [Gongronella butleri]|nr:hypothetical protein BC940DRAFT_333809 [Gongronella butleri]
MDAKTDAIQERPWSPVANQEPSHGTDWSKQHVASEFFPDDNDRTKQGRSSRPRSFSRSGPSRSTSRYDHHHRRSPRHHRHLHDDRDDDRNKHRHASSSPSSYYYKQPSSPAEPVRGRSPTARVTTENEQQQQPPTLKSVLSSVPRASPSWLARHDHHSRHHHHHGDEDVDMDAPSSSQSSYYPHHRSRHQSRHHSRLHSRHRSRSPYYSSSSKHRRRHSRSPQHGSYGSNSHNYHSASSSSYYMRSTSHSLFSKRSTTLYVGNIPYYNTFVEMYDVFQQHGVVTGMFVPKLLYNMRKNVGYAVVEYAHPNDAVRALRALDGKKIHGITLHVQWKHS